MSRIKINTLENIVDFNPKRFIKKGKISTYIDMFALPINSKYITEIQHREFKGNGSKFKNGDTLFARITPCLENGKTAIVNNLNDEEIAHGSTEFIVLSAKNPFYDKDYVYYLSRNFDFRNFAIERMQGTSGRKRVKWQYLTKYKFVYFDKKIRKKIANVLSVLDDKIELNNRINADLEAMAKQLYDYWFVQFDFPDANGKPYKSSGGKMVYNKTLNREIPEGWGDCTISDLILADKTGDWGKELEHKNYNLQVCCIRGADINGLNGIGEVNSPVRFINCKNKFKVISDFDFIIEISGGSPTQSTGRMSYITKEMLERFKHPVICSNFCKVITLKNNSYFYNFAYLWKQIYSNDILFGWEGKTSGIKNLLFDAFVSKYQICMPPLKYAKLFYNIVSFMEIKKQKSLLENQTLKTLRDWLLPMLMNGQVKVK